jgi:hypothetical protein
MGFIGDIFSSGGTDTLDRADELFRSIELPDYEQQITELKQLLATGQISPEEYQAAQADPSLLSAYKADPRLREAQIRALGELENVGRAGGMTAADKARIGEIQRAGATAERGSREAILQRAAERGVGGSGLEIASQLQASQAAADRAAQEGADVAARAEERALSALMGAGQLGGSIRGQDFGEQERVAAAQDAINKFNVANTNQERATNTAVRNAAQEMNVGRRWDVQNEANRLRRQRFEDEMAKASGRAGIASNQASMEEERRRSGAQFGGGLAAAGIGALMMSDERAKENVEPAEVDLDEFMKGLTVNKFEYKNPENGQGEHFGPMAQDFEKSPVGKSMVAEGDDGMKRVDYGKASGVMMAVLKDLYDRVEGLERAG